MIMRNINTKAYWDARFSSGDWASNGGFVQTRWFAEAQIRHLQISRNFSGTLCDFGCGAGDAFPVYRKAFPGARLLGVDVSDGAIALCKERYGNIADFRRGGADMIPEVDIIICSNVIEHVDDDVGLVEELIARCARLYMIVPYKESPLIAEHVHSYDETSFASLSPSQATTFLSKGWSEYGRSLWLRFYLGNVVRAVLGRPLRPRRRQILFEFRGGEVPHSGR